MMRMPCFLSIESTIHRVVHTPHKHKFHVIMQPFQCIGSRSLAFVNLLIPRICVRGEGHRICTIWV